MKNLKSVPVLLATLLFSVNAVAEVEKPQTTQYNGKPPKIIETTEGH